MGTGNSTFHEFLNSRSCSGKIEEKKLPDSTRMENSSFCFKNVEVFESLMPFARFINIGIDSYSLWRINLAVKPVNWQFPRCF